MRWPEVWAGASPLGSRKCQRRPPATAASPTPVITIPTTGGVPEPPALFWSSSNADGASRGNRVQVFDDASQLAGRWGLVSATTAPTTATAEPAATTIHG